MVQEKAPRPDSAGARRVGVCGLLASAPARLDGQWACSTWSTECLVSRVDRVEKGNAPKSLNGVIGAPSTGAVMSPRQGRSAVSEGGRLQRLWSDDRRRRASLAAATTTTAKGIPSTMTLPEQLSLAFGQAREPYRLPEQLPRLTINSPEFHRAPRFTRLG
jgi:hypothetical protein